MQYNRRRRWVLWALPSAIFQLLYRDKRNYPE
jgi:hypothetical protein